ncbi:MULTISPECIES: hypothetical protein [unclassified Saccharopolyspora]|nr:MULTISPECIES: hypothetical protein [unclassified Saccharopolyspora]
MVRYLIEQKAGTKGGYVHNRNLGNVTGTVIQEGEIHGNISL